MQRDPESLISEAAAYRELARAYEISSMRDALEDAAAALEALAVEVESYRTSMSERLRTDLEGA
ncbi:hypothetical protein KZ813_16960 [Sphingomonas sp. RHCKR7]|uniref:hypothetical protein n=1 Tax=Sphingomonas folli TaxID=2862497 RepID=UPI001CA4970F|nr:hypothetical protein [Sphingomonas folli]MBW6528535.1 hypothetical protein [Sphingomonas folli]